MEIITLEEKEYLFSKMVGILDRYNYDYTARALDKIIDTWAKNKADLIQAFKKHPNYVEGKFMIAFDVDYDREINKDESRKFSNWIYTIMETMKDSIPSEMKELMDREIQEYESSMFWTPSHNKLLPADLYSFLAYLGDYAERTISEETAAMIERSAPNAHIHAGMKTSRAVNKLCTYLGYNKAEDYNKKYAAYADSLSPLKIKRHTILSINPLDYLTMSIGNSWTSCHSIETDGRERGCYSSGTISYMLDAVSMVFYTIGAEYNGNDYYDERKIVRQMFFFGEEKLIQSRLYPQSNDYNAKEYYDSYRAIVQKIVSDIFDFPNLWKVSRGSDAASRYIYSEGTHYTDYCSFDNCTLSRITGSENEGSITVGHDPICIECGDEHSTNDNINCCKGNGYYCYNCGCWIDEEDVRWIDGEAYCSDCTYYCDCCDEYVLDETTWIPSEHRYVCDDCLDDYYSYCEECEEYVYRDDMVWVSGNDTCVCQSCFEHHYAVCDKCGEAYNTDDLNEHEGRYYCNDCIDEVREEDEEAC